jgi:hypothetical protein
MAELVQGKNEYLYFFIERKLECVGTDTTLSSKKFTVAKTPIANRAKDGVTVAAKDIEVYEGDAKRSNLSSIAVTTVNAKTGEVTLTNTVTAKKSVYCTYQYEYGNVAYATEYSATTTLDTKDITPVSKSAAEILEVGYKYEGSIKMYDDTDLENELMLGIDQTDDTVGGKLYTHAPIPVPKHNCVTKKVRGSAVSFQMMEGFKMSSLEDATKGGDLREKSFKFSMDDLNRSYTPVTGSIML